MQNVNSTQKILFPGVLKLIKASKPQIKRLLRNQRELNANSVIYFNDFVPSKRQTTMRIIIVHEIQGSNSCRDLFTTKCLKDRVNDFPANSPAKAINRGIWNDPIHKNSPFSSAGTLSRCCIECPQMTREIANSFNKSIAIILLLLI